MRLILWCKGNKERKRKGREENWDGWRKMMEKRRRRKGRKRRKNSKICRQGRAGSEVTNVTTLLVANLLCLVLPCLIGYLPMTCGNLWWMTWPRTGAPALRLAREKWRLAELLIAAWAKHGGKTRRPRTRATSMPAKNNCCYWCSHATVSCDANWCTLRGGVNPIVSSLINSWATDVRQTGLKPVSHELKVNLCTLDSATFSL